MAYYSSGNSLQRQSPIVFNLIIINILVFLAQKLITQFNVTEWGALHYYKSTLFMPHQLITNMFLHSPENFFHLVFNMFNLYVFGTILERSWGSKKFFLFYIICGLGASIMIELTIPFTASQAIKSIAAGEVISAADIASLTEMYKEQYSAIGASGAVMGLMAAYVYLFPNTELMVMFIPVPVKAKYVIPVFMLIDLFGGFYKFKNDNIGHFAHLGGALVGFLLVIYWNKTNKKTFY
jgi:membrane associated rhomboid family serine protease